MSNNLLVFMIKQNLVRIDAVVSAIISSRRFGMCVTRQSARYGKMTSSTKPDVQNLGYRNATGLIGG